MAQDWTWKFLEFKSAGEGCPVKRWYDLLPPEHVDEILSVLRQLQIMVTRPWPEDYFDPLEGEGGISEIRIPQILEDSGSKIEKFTYRIYGVRQQPSYTFLHATDKKRRNDLDGKRTAQRRFEELRRNAATVREFDFQGRSLVTLPQRP